MTKLAREQLFNLYLVYEQPPSLCAEIGLLTHSMKFVLWLCLDSNKYSRQRILTRLRSACSAQNARVVSSEVNSDGRDRVSPSGGDTLTRVLLFGLHILVNGILLPIFEAHWQVYLLFMQVSEVLHWTVQC